MERENLKESLLVDLRSVIQSCKGGVPLNRLQSDFKKLIGTSIPFQTLGYKTLEAYLQDIPHAVKLRKNPDGQLFAEAVANASTVHLANLISKQKGVNTKSLVRRGKYGFKTTSSKSTTSSSKLSIGSDEKDKIIEDLKSQLEREKKINKDFSSQMIRCNSLIKIGQDSLLVEQELVRKLENQLEVAQASSKKEKAVDCAFTGHSAIDIGLLIQEIDGLKSKLQEEKKLNEILSTRLGIVHSRNQTKGKDLPSTETIQQFSQCDIFDLYQQQFKGMEELKSQLQQQNLHIQNVEKKLQQQFQKFTAEVKKQQSEESINMETIVRMLMKQLQSRRLNQDSQSMDVREQARARFDRVALMKDELTIKEGDIITVISKETESTGWWKGELNDKVGIFPGNFVEVIKAEKKACQLEQVSVKKRSISVKNASSGIAVASTSKKKCRRRKRKAKVVECPMPASSKNPSEETSKT